MVLIPIAVTKYQHHLHQTKPRSSHTITKTCKPHPWQQAEKRNQEQACLQAFLDSEIPFFMGTSLRKWGYNHMGTEITFGRETLRSPFFPTMVLNFQNIKVLIVDFKAIQELNSYSLTLLTE